MKMKINIEIYDSLINVINKIKDSSESQIELIIPEGAVILENIINLKLLQKQAHEYGKEVTFSTNDKYGNILLDNLNGENHHLVFDEETQNIPFKKPSKRKISLGFISLSTLKNKVSFAKNKKKKIVLPVAILTVIVCFLGFALFYYINNSPTAQVEIKVKADPLIKSTTVTVLDGEQNDAEAKVVKGTQITVASSKTGKIATTGEKTVGEKAEGKIKIYNKTTSEKKFKEGDKLQSDDNLTYLLKEDVTVDQRTEDEELVITPGEAEVEVIAAGIGNDYNLDKNEDLEFEDYDKDDYSAKVSQDIDGGSSENVKVVAAEDLTNLQEQTNTEATQNIQDSLKNKAGAGNKFIEGSQEVTVDSLDFDAEENEEAEELTLVMDISATGLAYAESDLNSVLEQLLQTFVPDGFKLSDKDTQLDVSILGNTEETVLNNVEADLQATIKTYIIPSIDEEQIKNDLAGKSLAQAKEYLGNVRNVSYYNINMDKGILLLNKLPKNPDKITVEIVKE